MRAMESKRESASSIALNASTANLSLSTLRVGGSRIERAVGMNTPSHIVAALKELIESVPTQSSVCDLRDIGEKLADAMEDAGYILQCYQGGIRGTRLIAEPL